MQWHHRLLTASSRLWTNWPLWGGVLAMVLLAQHVWILFAPSEHAMPSVAAAADEVTSAQLFGASSSGTPSASAALNGIRPIGIFAHPKRGFAVLQTGSGQVGVGLGELVAPGVRLVETHPDYVVLDSNGTRQRVDLNPGPALANDAIVHVARSPAPSIQPAAPAPVYTDKANNNNATLTPEQLMFVKQQMQIRGQF